MAAFTPVLSGPPDDRDLVRLWAEGDEDESVRRLLVHHGGRVRAALRKRFPTVRDDHILFEALNEAARTVFEAYDPEKGAALATWFLLLASRRVCDLLRGESSRRKRTQPLASNHDLDHRPSPPHCLLTAEFQAAVDQALTQLTRLERSVIEADIDAGKQAAAERLAERLRTTVHSIYAARARARRKLLKLLPPTELVTSTDY